MKIRLIILGFLTISQLVWADVQECTTEQGRFPLRYLLVSEESKGLVLAFENQEDDRPAWDLFGKSVVAREGQASKATVVLRQTVKFEELPAEECFAVKSITYGFYLAEAESKLTISEQWARRPGKKCEARSLPRKLPTHIPLVCEQLASN